MRTGLLARDILLHGAVLALLAVAAFLLPDYHHGVFARVMLLAIFAMGYNIAFGYAGLLSLGHALYFAAGIYGAALPVYYWQWSPSLGFASGLAAGIVVALISGILALRTRGVGFMIVTLMFAQTGYLTILYYGAYTRGDEGLVLPQAARQLEIGDMLVNLADARMRYWLAFGLFAIVLLAVLALVRSSFGRALVAIRENEERMRMLGYNVFALKLCALILSGLVSAAAGAAYALLFGYAGASFAATQYSILPLLYVLVGGTATTLGPFFGTLIMFYLIDLSSTYTTAHWLVVGIVLILLVRFFRKGLVGTLRDRWLGWLP